MEKNNNLLVETISFIIIIAIYSLIFFGLDESVKTSLDIASYGFIVFGILVCYLSIVLQNVKQSKSQDIVSCGILYTISTFLLNTVMKNNITTMKDLIIYNSSLKFRKGDK